MSEIIGLQATDILPDGRLNVRIAKNVYSPRVIPLTKPAARFAYAWSQLYSRMPLKSIEALSHCVRRVLDECGKDTQDHTFAMLDPHQATRVTFANIALRAGVETEYLESYIGHAPKNVMSNHYGDLTPKENDMPRILNAKVEQLQNRVTGKIENKLTDGLFLA